MIHTILQGRIAVPNNTVIDSNFASYSNSAADVFVESTQVSDIDSA
jgi:hypothetical protein